MTQAKNHSDFVSEISCCDCFVLRDIWAVLGFQKPFSFRKKFTHYSEPESRVLGTDRFSTLSFCYNLKSFFFSFITSSASFLCTLHVMKTNFSDHFNYCVLYVFLKDNLFKNVTCYYLKISNILYNA